MPQHTEAERRRGLTPGLISNIEGFEAIPPGVLQRILGERAGGMAERVADFFTEGMFNREDPRMGEQFPGRPGPVDALIAALGVKGIGSLAKRGYNSLVRPGFGAKPIKDLFGMNTGPIGRREFLYRGSGRPRRLAANEVSQGVWTEDILEPLGEAVSEIGDAVRLDSTQGVTDSIMNALPAFKEEANRANLLRALSERKGLGVDLSDRAVEGMIGRSGLRTSPPLVVTGDNNVNERVLDLISDVAPETMEDMVKTDAIERLIREFLEDPTGKNQGTFKAASELSKGAFRDFLREVGPGVGGDEAVEAASEVRSAVKDAVEASDEAEAAVKEVLDDLFGRFGIKRGRQ